MMSHCVVFGMPTTWCTYLGDDLYLFSAFHLFFVLYIAMNQLIYYNRHTCITPNNSSSIYSLSTGS